MNLLLFVLAIILIFIALIIITFKIQKKIQNKDKINFWIAILSLFGTIIMCLTLILNVSIFDSTKNALEAQYKGTPPIETTLKPSIQIEYNFVIRKSEVSGFYRITNQTRFFINQKRAEVLIENQGQMPSGPINIFLQDIKGEFQSKHGYVSEIESLNYKYADISYWDKNCSIWGILDESDIGDNTHYTLNQKCELNSLNICIKQWRLKIRYQNKEECYLFNGCIFSENFTREECIKKIGKSNLEKETDCSKWNNQLLSY